MNNQFNPTRRRLLNYTAVTSATSLLPSLSSAAESDLQSQLNWLVRRQRQEGRISSHERTSWAVFDFQTQNKLVSINTTRYMQAASMVKVFVALAYFYLNQQAPHKYPYNYKERYLMERMLVKSSNQATNTLMKMCKGPANVERLCQLATRNHFKRLHIVEYIPAGGRTYRNKVAAEDYNRFLARLWHNQLPHSYEIKRIMSIKNHDRITTSIMPAYTKVYDKTGSTGMLCGDMGIIEMGPNRAYTFVGIIERSSKTSNYSRWISTRSSAMREASTLVYRFMQQRYQLLSSIG